MFRLSKSAGFSLAEIITVLAVFSVLSASALRIVVRVGRSYREQVERLAINRDLRVGITIVTRELMNLSASDPAGSDILSLSRSDLVYNSMRVLAHLCRPADAGDVELVVARDSVFGYRSFDPNTDSLLLHAGMGEWVRVDLGVISGQADCPDSSASLRLGVSPVPRGFDTGTPVRGFEGARLHLYRSDGFWLGANRRRKNGTWTRTQPIIGPLSQDGFQLEFYDDGVRTTDRALVKLVAVRLAMLGPQTGILDTIEAEVAIRN